MADLRRLLVAALLALSAGCAGVPHDGPVRDERSLPLLEGADDVRVLAESARPGAKPIEVVRGFLRAAASFENEHAVARSYLTPEAAGSWRTDRVAVYDAASLRLVVTATGASTAAVRLSAARTAAISPDGTWSAAPTATRLNETYPLVKVQGEWRIQRPPEGLRLTGDDIERSYRALSVYFLNADRDLVVPDQRYLPVDRPALSTALVRALVAGPSAVLREAVRTAVPTGTTLIGTAPVVDGIVTIDLSRAVLNADARGLVELSAQVAFTLRGLGSEVAAFRLLADGAPLKVAGAPTDQPVSSWAAFDPDAGAEVGAFLDAKGRLRLVSGEPVRGPVGSGELPLAAPALGPGGDVVAGVRAGALHAGPATAPLRFVVNGPIARPSVDQAGRVWAATTDEQRRVLLVERGRLRAVVADLPPGRLTALRVSRDGARVAVLAAGRIWVGRVSRPTAGGLRLEGFAAVAPGLLARDLAWSDSDDLVALAHAGRSSTDVPWLVSSDGYRVQLVPVIGDGLRPYSGLAGGPDSSPLLASDATAVYRYAAGRWVKVAAGSSPIYPG